MSTCKHAERPREPTDCPTGRGSHATPGPGPEDRCTTAGGRASVGDVRITPRLLSLSTKLSGPPASHSHRMVKELTKSRRHACPQCDAAFGKASHLSRHVRTVHEQRKDHACPQCDAAFGQAGNLRKHVRTVHEKRKDHACPQCDAAFGQASHLRTHVRAVHEHPPPLPPPVPPPMPPPMPQQQLGDVAAGIWSHALLNLVQPGNRNTDNC
jgi:uncharacterized C2H2 Zn-finger protein